jgi:hypothetical protein
MAERTAVVRAIFRGLTRNYKTFSIEVGPVRATGVPAILVGVTGIVLASGITALLAGTAKQLPETLAVASKLADVLKNDRPRLNA